jgi:hypothetical protein
VAELTARERTGGKEVPSSRPAHPPCGHRRLGSDVLSCFSVPIVGEKVRGFGPATMRCSPPHPRTRVLAPAHHPGPQLPEFDSASFQAVAFVLRRMYNRECVARVPGGVSWTIADDRVQVVLPIGAGPQCRCCGRSWWLSRALPRRGPNPWNSTETFGPSSPSTVGSVTASMRGDDKRDCGSTTARPRQHLRIPERGLSCRGTQHRARCSSG